MVTKKRYEVHFIALLPEQAESDIVFLCECRKCTFFTSIFYIYLVIINKYNLKLKFLTFTILDKDWSDSQESYHRKNSSRREEATLVT